MIASSLGIYNTIATLSKLKKARQATRTAMNQSVRSFHNTPIARGGGHGGHDYLHAQYMYQFRFKPASKVRAGVLMTAGIVTGIGIPIFAVWFNQKKAGLI